MNITYFCFSDCVNLLRKSSTCIQVVQFLKPIPTTPAIAFTCQITQPILQDCTSKTMKHYAVTSFLQQEHLPQPWQIYMIKVCDELNHMCSILRFSCRFDYCNRIGPQSQNTTYIPMIHSMTKLKIHQAMLLSKCNILENFVTISIPEIPIISKVCAWKILPEDYV